MLRFRLVSFVGLIVVIGYAAGCEAQKNPSAASGPILTKGSATAGSSMAGQKKAPEEVPKTALSKDEGNALIRRTAAKSPKPPPAAATEAAKPHPALLDPRLANEQAPGHFKAKFETSKGEFVIEVHREWAPLGADRFYNLVKIGFYDNVRFFRVIQTPRPFMAQFGLNGDPKVSAKWRMARIKDEPGKMSNIRGYISYAKAGPNSRTTQVFINYDNNARLDSMGFSPFGQVVEGMEVVDSLYGDYGEGAPRGRGPNQNSIQQQGNAYLEKSFPKLDYVKHATIVK